MHGHVRIATLTVSSGATVIAQQCRRKAASIDKHQRLSACLQMLGNSVQQSLTQTLRQRSLTNINKRKHRRRRSGRSGRQP